MWYVCSPKPGAYFYAVKQPSQGVGSKDMRQTQLYSCILVYSRFFLLGVLGFFSSWTKFRTLTSKHWDKVDNHDDTGSCKTSINISRGPNHISTVSEVEKKFLPLHLAIRKCCFIIRGFCGFKFFWFCCCCGFLFVCFFNAFYMKYHFKISQ